MHLRLAVTLTALGWMIFVLVMSCDDWPAPGEFAERGGPWADRMSRIERDAIMQDDHLDQALTEPDHHADRRRPRAASDGDM
jgi:hypothetical protein